jgi:hypothetical protein
VLLEKEYFRLIDIIGFLSPQDNPHNHSEGHLSTFEHLNYKFEYQ